MKRMPLRLERLSSLSFEGFWFFSAPQSSAVVELAFLPSTIEGSFYGIAAPF